MDSDAAAAAAPLPPAQPSPRWRRLDLFKVFCLLVVPLFLLVSYWTPFHGRYPTREELRDTLRELDEAAYTQSGCDAVAQVLARCEKFRVECPSQYYFELRSINRNCHALRCARARARCPLCAIAFPRWLSPRIFPSPTLPRSTKELETCLLETPGGKCVFEMVASWCGEGITEVLACHKLSMTQLLDKVLSPPFDSSRGAGAPAAAAAAPVPQAQAPARPTPAPEPPALSQRHEEWRGALRAAASAATLAAAEAQQLRLISWALPEPSLAADEGEEGAEVDNRVDYLDLAASGSSSSASASAA